MVKWCPCSVVKWCPCSMVKWCPCSVVKWCPYEKKGTRRDVLDRGEKRLRRDALDASDVLCRARIIRARSPKALILAVPRGLPRESAIHIF